MFSRGMVSLCLLIFLLFGFGWVANGMGRGSEFVSAGGDYVFAEEFEWLSYPSAG